MKAQIKATKNGPLHVTGEVDLVDDNNQPIESVGDLWLCRCGHSKNKPFCDSTHKKVGFTDEN